MAVEEEDERRARRRRKERRLIPPIKLDETLACWWRCSKSNPQHQVRSDVEAVDWLSRRMGRSQAGLHVRVSSGWRATGAASPPAAES